MQNILNTKIQIIETLFEDYSEWGISFTSNNPEPKDYFQMLDKETAFRLKKYLETLFQED